MMNEDSSKHVHTHSSTNPELYDQVDLKALLLYILRVEPQNQPLSQEAQAKAVARTRPSKPTICRVCSIM